MDVLVPPTEESNVEIASFLFLNEPPLMSALFNLTTLL